MKFLAKQFFKPSFQILAFLWLFNPISANAQIVDTELAGNALLEYPFFEYVKAINENATMEIAIDPSRFPEIVDQVCEIYVVNSKNESQWEVDNILLDQTRGGPETFRFSSANIQANTILIANPFDLSADAGTGFGVGYDIVLDCDRSGTLSSGDYIDGRSSESGIYMVHDSASPGPESVSVFDYNLSDSVATRFGIPPTDRAQHLFYPTNIATFEQLPLVVIGHGVGHYYDEYAHIGNHLASYGYIVVSHSNDVWVAPSNAAITTLAHTDAFIDQAETGALAGGDLVGKIDTSRIVWIGHSRGGEGVVIAYNRLFNGTYVPENYDQNDIRLISSMLPTDFKRPGSIANPNNVNYHLWTAAGDTDVTGLRGDRSQTFRIHDRATHFRHSTIVQGAGHTWFNNEESLRMGGFSPNPWFSGPCSLGPSDDIVHSILLGHLLPLIKYYVEGNVPAADFLTRQYESFRPIGVSSANPCIVVTHEHRNGAQFGNFVIDDYQTQGSTAVSSSGAQVRFNVENLLEGKLDDNDDDFTWVVTDPFNGATQAQDDDVSRGVVFDWTNENKFYEWEIPVNVRDFGQYSFISFRAAQGTQHPNTLAEREDLTFDVMVRDSSGNTSSINIGAALGGVEQPYERDDGWWNEMETSRVRISDFLNNGSAVNLENIVAIRLNFGPDHGSARGRLVLDELMLTQDIHPNTLKILEPTQISPAFAGTSIFGNRVLVRVVAAHEHYFSPETLVISVDGVPLNADQIATNPTRVGGEIWTVINLGPRADGCFDLKIESTRPPGVMAAEVDSLCYENDESRQFDRVLAIDKTNSMNWDGSSGVNSGDKMRAAQAAAKFYVDLSNPIDKIGIVSFQRRDENDDGSISEPEELSEIEFPLTLAGEGATDQREAAKSAIDLILPDTSPGFSGPETSPGSALVEAQTILNAEAMPEREKNIILLTDGLENYAPFWNEAGAFGSPIRPSFRADNIRVDTIGVGGDADDELLLDIANVTDGEFINLNEGSGSFFLLSRLSDWYKKLDEDLRGEQRFFYKEGIPKKLFEDTSNSSSLSARNQHFKREEKFAVEADLDWMTVAFHANIDDVVKVELFQPGASAPIVVDAPRVTQRVDPKYSVYRIRSPKPGEWRYVVHSEDSKVEFFATASAPTELMADLRLAPVVTKSKGKYLMPIRIWVADNKKVESAKITGYIRRPDGVKDTIHLLDVGKPVDGSAADGIYGVEYQASIPGNYFINLEVQGETSEGVPFKRFLSSGFSISGAKKKKLQFGEGLNLTKPSKQEQHEDCGKKIKYRQNSKNDIKEFC